jgi:hypothetical protein
VEGEIFLAKRKHDRGKKKVEKVMGEFKRKKLKSSSGKKVTSRPQAIAIALSEAGLSRKKKRRTRKKRRR